MLTKCGCGVYTDYGTMCVSCATEAHAGDRSGLTTNICIEDLIEDEEEEEEEE